MFVGMYAPLIWVELGWIGFHVRWNPYATRDAHLVPKQLPFPQSETKKQCITIVYWVQNVQLLLVHLNIFFSTCTGQYEAHFETYAPYFDHYCFSMRPLNQFWNTQHFVWERNHAKAAKVCSWNRFNVQHFKSILYTFRCQHARRVAGKSGLSYKIDISSLAKMIPGVIDK